MPAIVQDGDKILRKVAKPLPKKLFGSKELTKIIADMIKALDREPDGVALAAPQIGLPYRLFIVRYDRTLPIPKEGEPPHPTRVDVYINPQITKTSKKRIGMEEGCLSVRGYYGTVKRHTRATLKAQREDGAPFTRGAGGILAQIFEHEVDHLNGILFIDTAENLIKITRKDEK